MISWSNKAGKLKRLLTNAITIAIRQRLKSKLGNCCLCRSEQTNGPSNGEIKGTAITISKAHLRTTISKEFNLNQLSFIGRCISYYNYIIIIFRKM